MALLFGDLRFTSYLNKLSSLQNEAVRIIQYVTIDVQYILQKAPNP